jgi:hypothetical protein
VIGIVFLLVARRRRTGIGFLVAGVAFIILPYSIIYFLFN